MMECMKYTCSKNIHSLKDWRTEMLRLKKEHGANFEKHPDYVKMANCKEDILSAEDCGKLAAFLKTKKVPKTNTTRKRDDYDTYKDALKE